MKTSYVVYIYFLQVLEIFYFHKNNPIISELFLSGLNKDTMNNFTCNSISKHERSWSIVDMITFAPVYTTNIRGSGDNQKGSSVVR
jgi:hypothetical protein